MAEEKPLIAVVDDDPTVLRGVEDLLSLHGFDVKSFASPRALLAEIETLSPSCIVADLVMPDLTGLDLQRALSDPMPLLPIVFITGRGDVHSSVEAMRNGAVDFLTKPFGQQELLAAVQRGVDRGRSARQMREAKTRLDSLTRRERQVFDQVVAGHMNKQIANDLGISEKTVKVHRARVMRKMSVKSVAKLARLAELVGASTTSH